MFEGNVEYNQLRGICSNGSRNASGDIGEGRKQGEIREEGGEEEKEKERKKPTSNGNEHDVVLVGEAYYLKLLYSVTV